MNNLGKVKIYVEKKYQLNLKKYRNKRIIFHGVTNSGKSILLVTPESKIHTNGKAWVDITEIQKKLLQDYDIGIIAFRIKNGQVFYIKYEFLKKFLSEDSSLESKREGKHWKLRISPVLQNLTIQKSLEVIQLKLDLDDF